MKKFLAILMATVMVFALAACGSNNTAATTEAPKGDAETYTYTVDTGNYKNVWTLALNADGSYTLTEHNGLLDVDTEHAGKTFTKDGDKIACGPWDDPTGVPDFCEADGSITWQVKGDTIEPFIDLSNASKLIGTYVYEEDRGDFVMKYTVELKPDWSWSIEIFHGLSGGTQVITGDTFEELSDTSVKTGPREITPEERDFFNEDGSCVWNIVGEGLVKPENENPNAGGAAGSINPGKYTFLDQTPMGTSTWEIGLNGSGNGHITVVEDNIEYSFDSWKDNGDGTVSTSALTPLPEHIPGWMGEDGSACWKINADGTCEPVEAKAGVEPGKYTYLDETPMGSKTWGVGIFGNGGGMIELTEGEGEPVRYDFDAWVDNGDGTVTTGKFINGTEGLMLPPWFAEDGTATWKINADGTCEPVEEKASAVNPGKYTYIDETPMGKETWGVGIFGNGGGMIELTMGDGEPVRYDYDAWVDNGDGTVTTGKFVNGTDGVNLPPWFEADGSCTWRLNADETCEPVNK